MQALGPAAFGFVVAGVLTFFELITSKYPRTHVFLWKSWALYAYCAIYGVIALVVLLCFDRLAAAGVIKADGLGLSQPWIRALEIGIAAKALLGQNGRSEEDVEVDLPLRRPRPFKVVEITSLFPLLSPFPLLVRKQAAV
jgi:hypothetical protein